MSLLFHGIKDKKTLLKQLKAISWATALMLSIGQFYPMKTPYIQEDKSKVALEPWKNRFWIYWVLMGLRVGLYWIFS